MIRFLWPVILLLALLPTSCQKEDNGTEPEAGHKLQISQADTEKGLYSVVLMADDTLFVGYNKLSLLIRDNSSGNLVDNAVVRLFPLMNMVSMKHAAPVENPSENADSDGYFDGTVVFVMPDNPDEHWSLGVTVSEGGRNDSVSLSIPLVKSLKESRLVNVVSPENGKTYFIALLEPSKPVVGMNDIEFAAFYREDMMHFPPAEDLKIGFVPEMPSMGHSSPNNADPEYTGGGHYKGIVNFTMTGWWRINLTIEQGEKMLSDTLSFGITF